MKPLVIVEISDGIPDFTYSMKEVEVISIDWDLLESGMCPICWEELDESGCCPDHGNENEMGNYVFSLYERTK